MKFLYAIENMVESLWDIVFILFSYFDDIIKVFYTFCCFFCCNFCICISFVYFQCCLDMVPILQYQLCDAHLLTISSFYQMIAPMNRFPLSLHQFTNLVRKLYRIFDWQSFNQSCLLI